MMGDNFNLDSEDDEFKDANDEYLETEEYKEV